MQNWYYRVTSRQQTMAEAPTETNIQIQSMNFWT